MELPSRDRGDQLLGPGKMAQMRIRLRNLGAEHDLVSVISNAFDPRTHMLPFLYADTKMAPAGPRAIGAAMADVGFEKTRIVLGQWNRNFRPSRMRLDGRIPDLFMVSSILLHSASCESLIRDACRIDPASRPLIIAGGPRVNYEPWAVFSANAEDPWGADVAVTGEEYVLLSLLDVLLSIRASGESMRSTFVRARDCGALDEVPGLVYARTDSNGVAQELVDTGIQRLVGDLDELPHPALGYHLLEPPSRADTLGPRAIPADRVHKFTRLASLVLTQGCHLRCPYCPIPAYNQRQYRVKSGERISDEIQRLVDDFNIRMFFGADDNFFADRERTMEIAETLARKVDGGSYPHSKIRWGTEATVCDTLKLKDQLPTIRKAGLWALWLGVEDMSGQLVRKGQDANKTGEAFRLLRQSGIFPIPMLMHHDSQPFYSWKDDRGLVNQLGMLRKAGAIYMQVLMLTPMPGSKLYEETYTSGLVIKSAGGQVVEPAQTNGMYVIASRHPRPWVKQLSLLAAYVYFFNPLRLLLALVRSKSQIPLAAAETWPPPGVPDKRPKLKKLTRKLTRKLRAHLGDAAVQLFGMLGILLSLRRTMGWAFRLMFARIERHRKAPASPIPMRNPCGGPASHALPGTPQSVSTIIVPLRDMDKKA
ncbi:MAG: radical SAM protein [Lentisphaerae bacterium]|nr:radical SAM protein [Lentisphaerota bacterium]